MLISFSWSESTSPSYTQMEKIGKQSHNRIFIRMLLHKRICSGKFIFLTHCETKDLIISWTAYINDTCREHFNIQKKLFLKEGSKPLFWLLISTKDEKKRKLFKNFNEITTIINKNRKKFCNLSRLSKRVLQGSLSYL